MIVSSRTYEYNVSSASMLVDGSGMFTVDLLSDGVVISTTSVTLSQAELSPLLVDAEFLTAYQTFSSKIANLLLSKGIIK